MTAKSVPQRPSLFPGFEPLDANYLYCPNQFFDVLLPHASRGTLRLVSYLLRRTLGWLDQNGEPIEQEIAVSYRELTEQAGISTRAIPAAIEEALAGRFIACVRAGRRDTASQRGQSAMYRLHWDDAGGYTKLPKQFAGFYAGNGHRSPIPNAFFDLIVPQERLAVVKVVGTVLRYTIGYENQFGGRRSKAPLSYSFIQKAANLRHRPTLAEALRDSVRQGYIRCAEYGCFDPNAGRDSRATSYAVKWLGKTPCQAPTAINAPAGTDHGKNRTDATAESAPENDGKHRTGSKTASNDTHKQQAAAVDSEAVKLLGSVGFDDRAAERLAAGRGVEEIQRQVEWLEHRQPSRNRLGMLRKAIEEDWAAPEPVAQAQQQAEQRQQQRSEQHSEVAAAAEASKQRLKRRRAMLKQWRALTPVEQRNCHERAIEEALSAVQRARLQRHQDFASPPTETLQQMKRLCAAENALPVPSPSRS